MPKNRVIENDAISINKPFQILAVVSVLTGIIVQAGFTLWSIKYVIDYPENNQDGLFMAIYPTVLYALIPIVIFLIPLAISTKQNLSVLKRCFIATVWSVVGTAILTLTYMSQVLFNVNYIYDTFGIFITPIFIIIYTIFILWWNKKFTA